jgi:hypothetical protein
MESTVMGKSIIPFWVWIILWVTLFVYLGALALKKKAITDYIEKVGKIAGTVFWFLMIMGFLFGKHISDSEGFLYFW